MSNEPHIKHTLKMADENGNLLEAVVIGMDKDGRLQIYTASINTERLITLLERAKMRLIQSLAKVEVSINGMSANSRFEDKNNPSSSIKDSEPSGMTSQT